MKNNIYYIFYIFIFIFLFACEKEDIIIDSKTAPDELKNSKQSFKVSATYNPETNSIDLSYDPPDITNSKKHELYLGLSNRNPNEWSCPCEECNCKDKISLAGAGGGGGGSGGGGGGGSGGGSGNDECGDGYKFDIYSNNLSIHVMIDTNNDGIMDSDVITPVVIQAPTGLKASWEEFYDHINVKWTKLGDSNLLYEVWICTDTKNPSVYNIVNEKNYMILATSLKEDTTDDFIPLEPLINDPQEDAYYAVRAISKCGAKGQFSNPVHGKLKPLPGPSIKASKGENEDFISLTITDEFNEFSNYYIYREESGDANITPNKKNYLYKIENKINYFRSPSKPADISSKDRSINDNSTILDWTKKYSYYVIGEKVVKNASFYSNKSPQDLGWLAPPKAFNITASKGLYDMTIDITVNLDTYTSDMFSSYLLYRIEKENSDKIDTVKPKTFNDSQIKVIDNKKIIISDKEDLKIEPQKYTYQVIGIKKNNGKKNLMSNKDDGWLKDFGTVILSAYSSQSEDNIIINELRIDPTPLEINPGDKISYKINRWRDNTTDIKNFKEEILKTSNLKDIDPDQKIQPDFVYYYQAIPIKNNSIIGKPSNFASTILRLEDYKPVLHITLYLGGAKFNWDKVDGITDYEFTISLNPDFSNPIHQQKYQEVLNQPYKDNFTNSTHYYRLRLYKGSRKSLDMITNYTQK